MYKNILLCLWIYGVGASLATQRTLPSSTQMWWINSIKEQKPLQFAVQTDRFGFVFDYEKLNFASFVHGNNHTQTGVPQLSFGIETDGMFSPCRQSSMRTEDCQLVHTGRFLQHRFINWIPGLTGCDPHQSGLDMVTSNNRFSLALQIVPTVNLRSKSINITFELPADYEQISRQGDAVVFKHKQSDNGFLVMKTPQTTSLQISGLQIKARTTSGKQFAPGDTVVVGLIVYPLTDVKNEWKSVVAQELIPLTISAKQLSPKEASIETVYDATMGWYSVKLRNDFSGNIEQDNHRMEKVPFTIENPHSTEAIVRVNFSKDTAVYAITGISGIIRDLDGNPTGIPVQISKNWHTIDFNGYTHHRYRGPWYHGITEFKVPPHGKIALEYVGVNGYWGSYPAASHAQLCLVGWGQNQQWDQSAIGAWGEQICYEPDLDQASAAVLDVRPLFVLGPQDEKWGWTGNVGGADFFNMRKHDGKRAWHTAMKTEYKRQCPNLTEVVYSGNMMEGAVDIAYTTSVARSNDYTRGFFTLKMEVLRDITFDELAIFQLGAATYHFGSSNQLTYGNEKGMLKKWTALNNPTQSVYVATKQPCVGQIPWFSFTQSTLSPDQNNRFRGGDRGCIIRSWKARVQGKESTTPHWQEYSSAEGNHGLPTSIINITLPKGCNSLQKGDYVEAEIEMVAMPQEAIHYYGDNVSFKNYLAKYAGSWQLIWREAVGNNLKVKSSVGIVKHNYPIKVEAIGNQACFSIEGGVGAIPITICGLSGFRQPVLYEKRNGKWMIIDQSVHGRDFWQTDMDPITQTYEITYNIETSEKQKNKREFRFELTASSNN